MTRNFGSDGSPLSVTKIRTLDNAHASEGVVSGAAVSTGTGNFETDVASGVANVQGSRVTVAAETGLTHSTSASEDRIDLITVDATDTKTVTEGSAASTSGQPNAPDIPAGEVLLALVVVRGGSSEILAGDIHNEYKAIKEEIEDHTTGGAEGTVPTAQSDGSMAMGVGNTPGWVEDGNSPLTGAGSQAHTISLASSYDLVHVLVAQFQNTSGSSQQMHLRVNGQTGTTYTFHQTDGTTVSGVSQWGLNNSNSFGNNDELAGRVMVDGAWESNAAFRSGLTTTTEENQYGEFGWETNATSPLDSLTFRGASGNTDITARVFGWSQ